MKQPKDLVNGIAPARAALKDKVGNPSMRTDAADDRSGRLITVGASSLNQCTRHLKITLTVVLLQKFIDVEDSNTDRNWFAIFSVVAENTKHES